MTMTLHLKQPSASRDYHVQGMTCGHCASSVHDEVFDVHGVGGVDVDLASGRLSVWGAGFSDDAVRIAVAEAGYWVTT